MIAFPVLLALLVAGSGAIAERDLPTPAAMTLEIEQIGEPYIEARRIADRLAAVWPGWVTPEVDAALLPELSLALLGDTTESAHDTGVDRRDLAHFVGRVFMTWITPRLSESFRFSDAVLPAPEAWAARAIPRLAEHEAALLASAIEADSAEERTRLAREVLAARFRRVAAMHDRDVSTLRARELREGLALYSICRVIGTHEADVNVPFELRPEIRTELIATLRSAGKGGLQRYTPEISGLAFALLLDRVNPEWRELVVSRSLSLDSLLAGPPRNFGN